MEISTHAIKRFWSKVDKSGGDDACWTWRGSKHTNGYGNFTLVKGKCTTAHRAAWMIANQQEIAKGLEICHACDNRKCVNPAHLWIGTHAENMKDAFIKGRYHKPRCTVCWKPRRESWVIGNQVMCAACFHVKSKYIEVAPVIPLHRLSEAKQLNLFSEAA